MRSGIQALPNTPSRGDNHGFFEEDHGSPGTKNPSNAAWDILGRFIGYALAIVLKPFVPPYEDRHYGE